MIVINWFLLVLVSISDYNKTNEDPTQQYHDTQALAGVWTAVWELILAMIVKAVLTIFTFGMKVSERKNKILSLLLSFLVLCRSLLVCSSLPCLLVLVLDE